MASVGNFKYQERAGGGENETQYRSKPAMIQKPASNKLAKQVFKNVGLSSKKRRANRG